MLLRSMTTRFLCQLALSFAVFSGGALAILAQTKSPSPSPTPEKRESEETTEDTIYSAKEVDVTAKVTRPLEDPPKPGTDCPGRMKLLVTVRSVLRRSGDVTEVELVRESGCNSYDKDAVRAVRKMKFSPALKDHRPVSQSQVFEFLYTRF